MVFETGDLVVGWRRLLVHADGVQLDLARSMPLFWPAEMTRRSVRLVYASPVSPA
jgi:hypothetical protein